ncbi:uncharacterized protein LOC119738441 [Patiria miniata]|uniref:Ubiquitin-like protease family profile domain-containing protein n=1 Tax=Patiria miniata TaxID=46514 RepID=A0A914AYN3_PATMI|nr:uncharacterized protein LOC119738441 [Patiria miniata]
MAPVGLSPTCVTMHQQEERDAQAQPTSPARQTVDICCDAQTKRIKIIIRRLSTSNELASPWDQRTGTKRKTSPTEDCQFISPKKPRPSPDSKFINHTDWKAESDLWVPELGLRAKDRVLLTDGEWLTDNHIVAAQQLLHRQFPALEGLQEPVLGNVLQFKPIVSDGIQVIQNGSNHWVTLRKLGEKVKVMDSKNMGLTRQLTHQVINLCGVVDSNNDDDEAGNGTLEVRLPRMHRQRGSSDCGVFAVAYATEMAFQGNPELVVYEQKRLRRHLEACLECREMKPFPKKACKERTAREIGERMQVVQRINPQHLSTNAEPVGHQRST